MGMFDEFNKKVNKADIKKQIEDNKNNAPSHEVPEGEYMCKIDKMQLGKSKDGRPMFKMQLRITDGPEKKHCLFVNKVLYGTKNDGWMMEQVDDMLTLIAGEPFGLIDIECDEGFDRLAEGILELFQDVQGEILLKVNYEIVNDYGNVTIVDVYDV